jgi:hypothetical protein
MARSLFTLAGTVLLVAALANVARAADEVEPFKVDQRSFKKNTQQCRELPRRSVSRGQQRILADECCQSRIAVLAVVGRGTGSCSRCWLVGTRRGKCGGQRFWRAGCRMSDPR